MLHRIRLEIEGNGDRMAMSLLWERTVNSSQCSVRVWLGRSQ